GDQTREEFFRGQAAIAVSRTDNFARAAAGDKSAWLPPVIATRQASALFSDKEAIWADNAASSPFFGNVYVCNVAFRGLGQGGFTPEPVVFARSTDGGDTWTTRQISQAANTGTGGQGRSGGRQGCAVRTDSTGVVYVFWSSSLMTRDAIILARSFNGGRTFERGRVVQNITQCGLFDPVQERFTFDGVAGARTDSFPSVDIANGAPTGAGATNLIALTWCNGPTPTATSPGPNEQALLTVSRDRGVTWSAPVNAAPASDRPDFPAVAISPDGTDLYLVYMNFLQPWQPSALAPARLMQGVVRHADANTVAGTVGTFADVHRAPIGDARASSANGLRSEFLGDYNYVSATNAFAVAVWNDVRDAADCPAMDAYRQSLAGGPSAPRPAPQQDCPPTFGNSSIFGLRVDDPTP
ncbi:MAG: glycoside hydrolase, partial [Chloroflexota bacterium]|nr:glycoside hydrolase [Chloroflexota bacterium]